MSTNIKLSKAQISEIIQSGGFLGSSLSKLAGPLIKVAVPLAVWFWWWLPGRPTPYDVIVYQNFHKRLENDQKRLQFQMSGPPDFW